MTADSRDPARSNIDKAGVVSSTVCAVHCALTAAAPSLIAALGLSIVAGPLFEWGFTILAVLLASFALVIGWRRHETLSIALILVGGIVGLILGRLFEVMDVHGFGTVLSIGAGLALVVGHLAGIRASRAPRESAE